MKKQSVVGAMVLGMAVSAVVLGVPPTEPAQSDKGVTSTPAPAGAANTAGTAPAASAAGSDADAEAKEKAAAQARNNARKPEGGPLLEDKRDVRQRPKKAPPAAPPPPSEAVTTVAPKWEEIEKQVENFKPASGMKVRVVAGEPQVANPVAFDIDDKGRFWVVETFRFDDGGPYGGVYDIRQHMRYLDEDLACRTVEDRLKLATKMENGDLSRLTKDPDRIRLVEDTNGDGRADRATMFAGDFNGPMDGLAAGVLVRGGDVYFANLPNIWLLRDKNGDGISDERESLSYGYGVRYNFLGHDLHGLIWGPDGRLYFSMADRGLHVKNKEGKVLDVPDTGAVLRCEPDGSNLEIYATGLRNPQGLVFDKYGNLFSGDNNCDNGDFARWVYIVEGGDSGWRVGYQHLKRPASTGPWLAENLWMTADKNTGEYLLPPLGHIASGPSGNAYYPGTGMPEKYEDTFFQTDFLAGPSSSVHTFKLKPKGAAFEITTRSKLVSGPLTSDVKFGPGGGAYVLDWAGNGYAKATRGRIYHVFNEDVQKSEIVKEVKSLINAGVEKKSAEELGKLLGHVDMRVRQRAQLELAKRGKASAAVFAAAIANKDKDAQIARVHGIWGLGQIARTTKDGKALDPVMALVTDQDEEIRAQAAKALGDGSVKAAREALVKLLADASPRVRLQAALGLAKVGDAKSVPAVIAMLAGAEDKEPYLRHAGAMALAGIGAQRDGLSAVLAAREEKSTAARVGVLLALRRLGRPEVASFLNAPEPSVQLAAARAINDVPINDAMPELAKVLTRADAAKLAEPLALRALNANFRLGKAENAEAIARYANTAGAPESMRIEAMAMLGDWAKPRGVDRVVGVWRPLPERDNAIAATAAKKMITALLLTGSTSSPQAGSAGSPQAGGDKAAAPEAVRVAAIELLKKLTPAETDVLYKVVTDKTAGATPRVGAAALATMAELNAPRTDEAVDVALAQSSGVAREQAIKLLARRNDAAPRLEKLLANGSTADQQAVFVALGNLEGNAAAEQVLSAQVEKLVASPDKVKPELVLDILEAGAKWKSGGIAAKVKAYEAKREDVKDDPLVKFREALAGGDAASGRKIFYERTDVSCLRCHKVAGEGAGVAGPDLGGVGARHDRVYLLRSLVDPNADVAPGFEAINVRMKAGKSYGGVVKLENDSTLVLDAGDGAVIHAEKKEIEQRTKGLSGMPQDVAKPLSKRDLRDLVEFLANLKQPATAESPTPAPTPAPATGQPAASAANGAAAPQGN